MRPIPTAAASLLIAAAFACSPSDGSGSAASVGTPDSGSPDAGTPDAGPDGGGTATPPDGGGPPGSGGTPDGGGGSGGGGGGTPDGGGGSGGGGSDGGTVATDCDGIVPASLGDSFSATVENSGACSFAVSDFSGNVALESHDPGTSFPGRFDWFTFTSSGSPLGRIQSTPTLIPGDVGFEGGAAWNGANSDTDRWHVWAWRPDGSVTASASVGNYSCAGPTTWSSSSGGALVVTVCGGGDGTWHLYRVDDAAKILWSTTLSLATQAWAVGDVNGNTLVITDAPTPGPKPMHGRWIDGSGKYFTNEFDIQTSGPFPLIVHSLIGGGAAVMQGETWQAVLPSGGLPQAAPDWLASRPGTNIAIVRGRRAYAFTSRSGGSKVELVSPAGNSCGSIDVGGANVIVGGDGTVFTQTGDNGCRRTWYPALLR